MIDITDDMFNPYRRAEERLARSLDKLSPPHPLRKLSPVPRRYFRRPLKTPEKINAKMDKKGINFNQVYDIIGARIYVQFLDEVDIVKDFIFNCRDLLKQRYDGTYAQQIRHPDDFAPGQFQNYIDEPKGRVGYRSLHIVVWIYLEDLNRHIPAEIQVRTVLLDAWEEKESPFGYHATERPPDDFIQGQFYGISQMLYHLDTEFVRIKERARGGEGT